jgi:hypothetical protein
VVHRVWIIDGCGRRHRQHRDRLAAHWAGQQHPAVSRGWSRVGRPGEFLLGLLSDVESRSCWQLAEQAGHASPSAT